MKILRVMLVGLFISIGVLSVYSKDVKTRDEFIKYNDAGEIILHGKYTRDSNARVIRYDVYDGQETLQYYEIPYYKEGGRIIRCDTYGADGTLLKVAVFFEKAIKVFDKEGNNLSGMDQVYSAYEEE